MGEQEHIFIKKKDVKVFNAGRKQGALEILDKLKIAKQCIDYQNIKCDNKDCLNKVCPLNKNFKELESGVSK